jgi:methoxymalonate biosynthesis protein
MSAAESDRPDRLIKCVVWDLDNTLWEGIAAEGDQGEVPPPDERMLDIISHLEGRGIVSSVASRNDPSAMGSLLSHPALQGKFVAPQVSWEPKSGAVRRVATHLNIGLDSVAFVDDSPFERAEVSYLLPQVLVLAPEQLDEALEWPAFNPGSVTAEAGRRAEMYRQQEERRQAEAAFGGGRIDFLKWCEMRLTITAAVESDLARIVELTERTHQLNSTGRRYSHEEIGERIVDARWLVPVARLTDRFGDYGMIGAAIVDTRPPWSPDVWLAELVMLSCRVEGRGIPAALLRWVMGEARSSGMKSLRAVYAINEQNLPMRLLFRQMGFRKIAGDSFVTVARDLSEPLPDYPEWLAIANFGLRHPEGTRE